jgi:hypothetical protein
MACGGTTVDIPPLGPDGGGSGGLEASVADVATSADVSVPLDAKLDAPGPNTNAVTCGTAECARTGDGRGREVCCVRAGLPPGMVCTRELDPAACTGGRRACDDTADCAGVGVCCAETANDGSMHTACLPTCITGVERWQVCKDTSECPLGIPCTMGICPRQGVIGFCVGAALPNGCR